MFRITGMAARCIVVRCIAARCIAARCMAAIQSRRACEPPNPIQAACDALTREPTWWATWWQVDALPGVPDMHTHLDNRDYHNAKT